MVRKIVRGMRPLVLGAQSPLSARLLLWALVVPIVGCVSVLTSPDGQSPVEQAPIAETPSAKTPSAETPPAEEAPPEPQVVGATIDAATVDKAIGALAKPEVAELESIIATADIVAYYGHPHNPYMGILGETPLEASARGLRALADEYDSHNGERGIVAAFHIIYATAHPDAEVSLLDDRTVLEYIEYGQQNGLAIILDHQLGRHDAAVAIETMLPFLHYDNVHLAIDPEWSTEQPGQEIGSVSADEVNRAQAAMQEYLAHHDLPGRRMLVIHQFRHFMVSKRTDLRVDFERVDLIHDADGFGPPEDKYKTWNAIFTNDHPPHKGFKLFLPKSWRDFGYDDPLLTPAEVLALRPRPVLIIYQ